MATQIQLDLVINQSQAASTMKEYRKSLKELKETIAFGINPEDISSINKAEEAYKKLKDKIDDTNDSLKANAQDGLTRVGDQFKYVKDRVLELDFSKATGGLDQLKKTVTGISFSDISKSVGVFSESLGQLGKATWTALGPWGQLALIVGVVIGALYSLKDIIKPIGDLFNFLGRIFDSIIEKFRIFSDLIFGTNMVQKNQAEQTLKNAELEESIIKNKYEREIKLEEARRENSYKIKQEEYDANIAQYKKEYDAYKNNNAKIIEEIQKRHAAKLNLDDKQTEVEKTLNDKEQKTRNEIADKQVSQDNEKTRITKQNLQLTTQLFQQEGESRIIGIRSTNQKAIAEEELRFAAAKKGNDEYFKDQRFTKDQENKYLENQELEHANNLKKIALNLRLAEEAARISSLNTQLAFLNLAGSATESIIREQSSKRLEIINQDEKNRLKVVKGSLDQENAIREDARLKRVESDNKLLDDLLKNRTDRRNSESKYIGSEFLGGTGYSYKQLTNGLSDGVRKTLPNESNISQEQKDQLLLINRGVESGRIAAREAQNALDALDNETKKLFPDGKVPQERKDKVNQETISIFNTLEYAQKKSGDLATTGSASIEKSSINTKINNSELDFLKSQDHEKIFDIDYAKRKKHYDELFALKKQSLILDRDAELENADLTETQKKEIKSRYDLQLKENDDQKKQDDITNEKKYLDQRIKISTDLFQGLSDLTDLFYFVKADNARGDIKEEEQLAEQKFNINKALMLSLAIPQQAENILLAYKGIAGSLHPLEKALAIANFIAVSAAGVAQVGKIAASRFQKTSSGASQSATPPINLYGSGSNVNNLNATNNNSREQIRTYVLEADVTIAQTNVSRYKTSASLG